MKINLKHPTMKCRGWQMQWRSRLICMPAAMLFFVLSAQAQDRLIPPAGGPGGGEFVARCPPGQLLGGVELRAGDDVDAIRPLCRTPRVNVKEVRRARYPIGIGSPTATVTDRYVTYGVNGDAT